MAINVSVKYNGGLLPGILLLNLYDYHHRGIRLNATKRSFSGSLCPHLNALFDGMLRRVLDAFRFLFKQSQQPAVNTLKIIIVDLRLPFPTDRVQPLSRPVYNLALLLSQRELCGGLVLTPILYIKLLSTHHKTHCILDYIDNITFLP